MAEAPSAPDAFGSEQMMLSTELLEALTAGNNVRLVELLRREGRTASHVAIHVNGAGAVSLPRVGTSGCCCLLGVASNGNTALHLVAARNRCLDTALHCAARGGHREVAACLLSALRAGGADDAAALRATNRLGDTALHEAVRHGRAGVVDLHGGGARAGVSNV